MRRFSAFTVADTALPLATETVVATVTGVLGEFGDGHIELEGIAAVLGQAGTTNVTMRIRRSGLAGAIVGEASVTVLTGAVNGTCMVAVGDDFTGGAPPVYVLTATAAGGAATATQADLIALVS